MFVSFRLRRPIFLKKSGSKNFMALRGIRYDILQNSKRYNHAARFV